MKRWSLFCRVIDNFGDVGFCLRLARELNARGQVAQLFIDDPQALGWMQDGDPAPIHALPWPDEDAQPHLGDVVIETFGCELPQGVQRAIARERPLWINLEYLSAEPYVERSHGLPSPVLSGPALGCVKRFFFPGFSAATGGLLRERELPARWSMQEATAWWQHMGWPVNPRERQVSLFAYPNAPLTALVQALGNTPTRLLVSPGLTLPAAPPTVRVQRLPWLSQANYDCLLRSCDLNLVRGEDSFVRAQWAGRPFLWQIYPQHDGAHAAKLMAFLRLRGGDPTPWLAWNGLTGQPLQLDPLFRTAAAADALRWRDHLLKTPELIHTLMTWAAAQADG